MERKARGRDKRAYLESRDGDAEEDGQGGCSRESSVREERRRERKRAAGEGQKRERRRLTQQVSPDRTRRAQRPEVSRAITASGFIHRAKQEDNDIFALGLSSDAPAQPITPLLRGPLGSFLPRRAAILCPRFGTDGYPRLFPSEPRRPHGERAAATGERKHCVT